MKNLITLKDKYYSNVEIDLNDLEVTSDYEAALYHAPLLEARRNYSEHDVHNVFSGEAIPVLLEIIKDLSKRVKELEDRAGSN